MAGIFLTPDNIELTLSPQPPALDRELLLSPDVALLEVQVKALKISIEQPARTFQLGVAVLELQVPALVRKVDGECLLSPDAAVLELHVPAALAALTDRTLTPGAAVLELQAQGPTVVLAPVVLTPDAAVLELAPQALARADGINLTPDAAVLELQPGDVSLALQLTLTPSPAQLHFQALPPAASTSAERTVRLGVALLELRPLEPGVQAIDPTEVAPRFAVRGLASISGITIRPDPELEDLGP